MPKSSLLNAIESFIDERFDTVGVEKMWSSPDYQTVSDREKRLMKEIKKILTPELLGELEDTISQMSGVYTKYGYIQGYKDGAELQQVMR